MAMDEARDDEYVVALIQDLALSRSDCLSAQKRNDLVRLVEQFLTEKPGSRKALANSAGTYMAWAITLVFITLCTMFTDSVLFFRFPLSFLVQTFAALLPLHTKDWPNCTV